MQILKNNYRRLKKTFFALVVKMYYELYSNYVVDYFTIIIRIFR